MNTFPERSRLIRYAALAVLTIAHACALDPHRAMSQYVHDRWKTEQGFPPGPVYAISQTTDGYLWIGTEAGLLRFDGVRFEFIEPPASSPPLKRVLGLVPDKDGGLWIRLGNLGLVRYSNGRFEKTAKGRYPGSDVTASALTSGGEVLAARMQLGGFTYRGGNAVQIAPAQNIPRTPVLAIAQTPEGSIWLGTRGAGLFRLTGGMTWPVTSGLPDAKIDCLVTEGNDRLWIGTDQGVTQWDGSKITATAVPKALRSSQILALIKDRDANLWIGTDDRGVLRFNGERVEKLDRDPGESGDAITALFEDREGSLWMGSAAGLERLRDTPFLTFSNPERLPTDGSNPVFPDDRNRTWFSPVEGGLWWFQNDRFGSVSLAGLSKDIVYSIAGSGQDLWLGRRHGGLTRLRSSGASFEATTYTRADGLAQDSVYSVYQDRQGAVWAGTLSGGVSKWDGEKFTTYTIADGLASNTVASILNTADGSMWFATPSGLSAFSQGRWQTFTRPDGLPSENVNCLLQDSDGMLWAGTTRGIAYLRAGRFVVPERLPIALGEQIFGLAEDRFHSLWISTSQHVLRVRKDRLAAGPVEAELREFGFADGLRGVEGVKRHRSVVTDSAGRVWFSLNRGISVVDPARLTAHSVPAFSYIETVSADGRPLAMAGAVHISSTRKRIVFHYTGLSLSVPERVRFRYRLDGFDGAWSEPVMQREAAYTNLSPGNYRFRVVASNPEGVWSGQEAAIAFAVDPAYWQTWWFRASLAISILLAALGLYALRMRQLTSHLNLVFEERLAERTRIAQELHDTLLQGFLSASMQVHVAASRLPPESPLKPSLNRSLELMRQVIDEGRNAVRGLRSTRTESMDLEEAFSRIQDELEPADGAKGEPVAFRVIVEGGRMPLHAVLRDEVYRIGREALINAFRHARATSIEIELHYSPARLRLLVRDDGCGIQEETLRAGSDGHWGILGMRERAERIGAKLRLFSGANGGTEVELTVPGNLAFQPPSKHARGPRRHNAFAWRKLP